MFYLVSVYFFLLMSFVSKLFSSVFSSMYGFFNSVICFIVNVVNGFFFNLNGLYYFFYCTFIKNSGIYLFVCQASFASVTHCLLCIFMSLFVLITLFLFNILFLITLISYSSIFYTHIFLGVNYSSLCFVIKLLWFKFNTFSWIFLSFLFLLFLFIVFYFVFIFYFALFSLLLYNSFYSILFLLLKSS